MNSVFMSEVSLKDLGESKFSLLPMKSMRITDAECIQAGVQHPTRSGTWLID